MSNGLEEVLASVEEEKEHKRQQQRARRARQTPEEKAKSYEKAGEYLKNNREQWNRVAQQRRRRNKAKAVELMGNTCYDCKQSFHQCVYDFHHIHGKEKVVGRLMNGTWDKIAEELKKCVMICANCHRIRHHAEDSEQED